MDDASEGGRIPAAGIDGEEVTLEDRRLRPLEWLAGPGDREVQLQQWLDLRQQLISDARSRRGLR